MCVYLCVRVCSHPIPSLHCTAAAAAPLDADVETLPAAHRRVSSGVIRPRIRNVVSEEAMVRWVIIAGEGEWMHTQTRGLRDSGTQGLRDTETQTQRHARTHACTHTRTHAHTHTHRRTHTDTHRCNSLLHDGIAPLLCAGGRTVEALAAVCENRCQSDGA